MRAPFVHLHVHSYYSFFDSVLAPREIVELARQAGASAAALTDTNSLTGAVEFYQAAREAGLRPLLGAEVTEPLPHERECLRARLAGTPGAVLHAAPADDRAEDDSDEPALGTEGDASTSPSFFHGDPNRRIILLARDLKGYSEISHLLTRRALDPEFRLAREAARLSSRVAAFSDSLEMLDVLAAGAAADPDALRFALIQPSRLRRRRNRTVYEWARARGLPLLAACDVKLGTPEDIPVHDLLHAMRRLTTVSRLRAEGDSLDPAQHFQTEDQIRAFFGLRGEAPAASGSPDSPAALRRDLTDALAATARVAEACDCVLPLGQWRFPGIGTPPGCSPMGLLRRDVEEGLRLRYGTPLPGEVRRRADYELGVIGRLSFTDYFLLVHAIVRECRRRGLHVIGRGSAANSIVTYALGISNVCPIRHGLYFERFLNPERSAPPDIDVDLPWRAREEILRWCTARFGRERVALVSTIQTLRSRQAVREVAKAHGLTGTEITAFNKLQETNYCEADEVAGKRGAPARVHDLSCEEPWTTVLAQARRIAGFPRHLSVHCGGIVIAPLPVADLVPLTTSAMGFRITQMDMDGVEALGLIKMDLLGNRSLGVLEDALRLVEEREDPAATATSEEEEPAAAEPVPVSAEAFRREAVRMKLAGTRRGTSVALAGVLDAFAGPGGGASAASLRGGPIRRRVFDFAHITADPATRTLIDTGRTMGCFYIESPGMRALFERLRCASYEEVVTASSIIRPGVADSGMMSEYIDRCRNGVPGAAESPPPARRGRQALRIHPAMLDLLPETRGVMVYQEDVLRVAHDLAGMTYGEADLLRRAMSGKTRARDAMGALEVRFLAGVRARGLSGGDALEIWRQVASFAGYSFCKGHSAAFAVLSYQVTYLKAHCPAEFFAAVITNQGGFYGAGAYAEEARRWGLRVLGPCVQESRVEWTGRTEALHAREGVPSPAAVPFRAEGWIRTGLRFVEGLSLATCEAITAARARGGPFCGLGDFLARTGAGFEECRRLIKTGALDAAAEEPDEPSRMRPRLLLELARREALARHESASLLPAPGLLYAAPPGGGILTPLTRHEMALAEAQLLGFMVSAHPLDFAAIPPHPRLIRACDIRAHAGRRVALAGWLLTAKLLSTRTRNEPMKMLTLEDQTDTFEAILFPKVYARHAPRTLTRGPYLVEGVADMALGSPTLTVHHLQLLPLREF